MIAEARGGRSEQNAPLRPEMLLQTISKRIDEAPQGQTVIGS